jgi:hypothetical protein
MKRTSPRFAIAIAVVGIVGWKEGTKASLYDVTLQMGFLSFFIIMSFGLECQALQYKRYCSFDSLFEAEGATTATAVQDLALLLQ